MPSYDAIKEAVFHSKENPNLLAKMLFEINEVKSIGGTVSVTGTLKFNQLLTAVTTGITGNTGTLTYQWYRNKSAISSATSSTYTTVAADVGQTVSVKVSSTIEQGSVKGTAGSIAKAAGGSAPSVTGAVLSITGLTSTVLYEYKLASGTDYIAVAAGSTSITDIVAGSYKVRVAETATTLASADATVTVTAE